MPFILSHPKDPSHRIILVDTPGFGTGAREDHKIMNQLVKWLKKSYDSIYVIIMSLQSMNCKIYRFPSKLPRKIAILYLIQIDKHLCQKSDVYLFPKKLISQGISKNSIIVTTKWERLFDKRPGHDRREVISKGYSPRIPIRAFKHSSEAAWGIIDSIQGNAVDMTQFRRKLAKVAPSPFFGQLWGLFGLGHHKSSPADEGTEAVGATGTDRSAADITDEVETGENDLADALDISGDPAVIARLEELSLTLGPAFRDKDNYRKLLACRGPEAQALLDTFQSILRAGIENAAGRRNLIFATKRLSMNSGLYPSAFILEDVERLDELPFANGGFAEIWRGTFQKQPVSLKILRIIKGTSYDKVTQSIAREGILWGQLSHPNILPLWGIFRLERQLSLVSPWVNNGHIVAYLEKKPKADRVLLGTDIANGIDYLHENDIVHGDLRGVRPRFRDPLINDARLTISKIHIMVSDSGRACLADFGISSINDPEILYWASQSAAAGGHGGSERWQAPELFKEDAEYEHQTRGPSNSKAADIYAWSCVCLELFTGAAPFPEVKRDSQVVLQVARGACPALPDDRGDYILMGLTPDMRQLMVDCWARDPAQRPDAKCVLQRLEAIKPADTRPPGGWRSGPAMSRENLITSDVPLTLESLQEILSRAPPPRKLAFAFAHQNNY
ncbi:hypothetical protein H0H81_012681 [Sphagnurus paluster]|uniref:Protein kinase domain-containing protein n=1 Tax=Sphagnurus paluster TaxID=117069 RepID=A0A9P7FUD7_9AGAR|nr:hypothetical protein H0H81_012681 [Sphagnurus paluster]